ncbi:AFG1/ZapE family ATPase [Pseudarthrobacter sp. NamB4]|uniref:AFG1/ZapE family ATPase n=1 Tax=Pseudarthrobacter sp. NamB4 TaxID=2576837 RepID=UPI0010FF47DE|nr:AFG1/ZapE family ATPase [Pseudarthrobacter sp. NamB4]TLM75828.1 cell division protein ZapE [Pseudarthrobacter sp. NamB4]
MDREPEPPVLRHGRVIVPGTARQLAVYGLFPPSPIQHRELQGANRIFRAKASEPELLWISFDELCAADASAGDYRGLAAGAELWVIDGVPAPESTDAGRQAEAWERFAEVLRELAAAKVALFVVGARPMDWAAASATAPDAGLRGTFPEIHRLLARLERVKSDEAVAIERVSGS